MVAHYVFKLYVYLTTVEKNETAIQYDSHSCTRRWHQGCVQTDRHESRQGEGSACRPQRAASDLGLPAPRRGEGGILMGKHGSPSK